MEVKLEEIATPNVPKSLRARLPNRKTFTSFPLSAFSDDELKGVGAAYGRMLVVAASAQRANGSAEESEG
jgi:hypothetical protein